MLVYELVTRPGQFEQLLELVYHQKCAYLEPMLDLIQLTSEQFGQYFKTTGMAYRICESGELAGLCWVEQQGRSLFLHGLIIKDEYQGRGIGTQTLKFLESAYRRRVDCIELHVHISNPRAKALYERYGFETVQFLEDSGFYVMQKAIRVPVPLNKEWSTVKYPSS